jgi:hypothetical protein
MTNNCIVMWNDECGELSDFSGDTIECELKYIELKAKGIKWIMLAKIQKVFSAECVVEREVTYGD